MEYIIINYWAVLVAAVSYMIIGSLWYGPVFGKKWMGYVGITPESMKTMPLKPWQAILGGFVTALLMAYVLAHTIQMSIVSFGDMGITTGLMTAFWVWLGYVLTTQAGSYLWEGKPIGLLIINGANTFVSLMVMASIIVLWPF